MGSEMCIRDRRNYVYPLYSQEDIRYLQLDEEELNSILNKAHKLSEQLSELRALTANLVKHYKAMRQLYKLVGSTTVYDKLDKLLDKAKHNQSRDLDNLRFHIYLLISELNTTLKYTLETLVSLLIIESLRRRGYLDSNQVSLDLYHRTIRDFIKNETAEHIMKQLQIISNSFSRALQLVENILQTEYSGRNKSIMNIRSIARKMLVSFVVSKSLMSIESVTALLKIMLQTRKLA